jgi:phosphinothricin acetyltransferase
MSRLSARESPCRIRPAGSDDATAVAAIYNEAIARRAATFETEPRSTDDLRRRIEEDAVRHPVLVAGHDSRVIGWAAKARERGYWKLLSRVFPFNEASRALCRSAGLREVGTYEKHSRLDGQWLDVIIVERLIPENQV